MLNPIQGNPIIGGRQNQMRNAPRHIPRPQLQVPEPIPENPAMRGSLVLLHALFSFVRAALWIGLIGAGIWIWQISSPIATLLSSTSALIFHSWLVSTILVVTLGAAIGKTIEHLKRNIPSNDIFWNFLGTTLGSLGCLLWLILLSTFLGVAAFSNSSVIAIWVIHIEIVILAIDIWYLVFSGAHLLLQVRT